MVSISHENENENLFQSASECECKGEKEERGRGEGGRCHGNSSCIQNTRAGACRGHVWCELKLPPNSLLDLFFCVQELATELATARANAFIYSHAATANKYK